MLSYTIQKLLASLLFIFISLLPSYSSILQCSKCTSALCDQRYANYAGFYRNFECLGKSLRNSVHRRQCVSFTKHTDSLYLYMPAVLSLFARIAQIRDVDPTRNQRHRRASSASSQSSRSDRDLAGSRSSSRTSLRPSSMSGNTPSGQSPENPRNSMSGLDPSCYQWAERVPK